MRLTGSIFREMRASVRIHRYNITTAKMGNANSQMLEDIVQGSNCEIPSLSPFFITICSSIAIPNAG